MQDHRDPFLGNGAPPKAPRQSPAEYFAEREAAGKRERAAIFKNASFLAILLLLYRVFSVFGARIFWVLAYVRYFGTLSLDIYAITTRFTEEQPDVTGTTAFTMTGSVFIVSLASLGVLLTGQLIMRVKLTDIFKPYRGFAADGLKYFPSTLALNLLSGVVVSAIVAAFGESGISIPGSDFSVKTPSSYALVMQFLYVCVIGPVCEEFMYRGLVIKLLAPYGKGTAVLFSALVFGLMHGNIQQAIPAMMGGLVYALVAVRYNSIAPSIIIHILNNICASVSDFGEVFGWGFTDTLNRVIDILILFIGLYGIIVLLTELIRETRESEPECALPYKKRMAAVFTNVFVLVYLIYLIWKIAEMIIGAN